MSWLTVISLAAKAKPPTNKSTIIKVQSKLGLFLMNVNYLDTDQKALKAIDELSGIKKLCLDTETTGLQPRIAEPRLLQLCDTTPSSKNRTIYVFDLFKTKAVADLKALIESRELLILHNANFDLQFLLYMGIDFKNKIFDTYIAERVLRAGFKEKRYSPKIGKEYFADVSCSLKAVAKRRLGLELDKEQQVSDWSKNDLDIGQIAYSATDVDILPDIAADQISELKEENLMQVYSMESKCIRPVARMCSTGFGVDLEKLQTLKLSIEKELDKKVKEFVYSLDARLQDDQKLPRNSDGEIAIGVTTGTKQKKFNPGSTKQVIKACQACGILLPTDATTNKPVLNQIALAEFDSQDPTLLLYREQTKVQTEKEHVEKLLNNVHPITHRIHSGYNQVGANSGRFTSSGAAKTKAKERKSVFAVNIQQIPRSKQFRSCFIPEKGFKLVICDWSQIELRLGAQLINIPQMREAFSKNIDLHTLTASLIYKLNIEEVPDVLRQEGKTLNFALLYGMGYRKYKTYTAQSGKIISLSDAKVAHAAFHTAYPRLRAWHQERAALVQDGWAYVRTALGRRRLLSYDDTTMMCSANTLIQGSGADILKIAIAKLDEHLNDDVRLIACVHDELVLEVKDELAKTYKDVLETIMVEAAKTVLVDVPSKADAKVGDSWADK